MRSILNYGDGPKAIYEELKHQIIAGKRQAGEELKILPLAKEMQISTIPIREAFRMLAADNLVELRPRRSPIITHIDGPEFLEMNQIRGALEPIVLNEAVPLHTEKTIAECRKLIEQDVQSSDLWEKVELNRKFHLALLTPANMKRTMSIIADQYDGIARMTQFRVVEHEQLIGKPNQEHESILDAVESGDTKRAIQLMNSHIRQATVRAKNELSPVD